MLLPPRFYFFDPGSTIVVFFHFFVVGSLLVGCLYLAQQMGAHGASAMMKWGNKAGDWARNTIGDKAALRGTRYGLRYGGGAAADRKLKKRFAKSRGKNSWRGIGLRKLGAMKKPMKTKTRKAAEKYARDIEQGWVCFAERRHRRQGFCQRDFYIPVSKARLSRQEERDMKK